jgi:hypothetical protein
VEAETEKLAKPQAWVRTDVCGFAIYSFVVSRCRSPNHRIPITVPSYLVTENVDTIEAVRIIAPRQRFPMDHELREQCRSLISRILHLRDSL